MIPYFNQDFLNFYCQSVKAFKLAFDDIKIMEALNGKEFMGSFASQFVTLVRVF